MTEYTLSNILPDPIDNRDFLLTAPDGLALPDKVDLRAYAGNVENQGNIGSCVANATVSALEIMLNRAGRAEDLSRLFLYFNLREPYTYLRDKDIGSYLRDGFKSCANKGICVESFWPYITGDLNVTPVQTAIDNALTNMVTKYARVSYNSNIKQRTTHTDAVVYQTKAVLASGFPCTISMNIGAKFYSIRGPLSTHVYPPISEDNKKRGGHAVCVVGYDDSLNGFIVENSWGSGWADNGYFLLPYDTFIADVNDVWVCTEFDGIAFDPIWENTNPPLIVPTITSYEEIYYTENSVDISLTSNIHGGTGELSYTWSYYQGSDTGKDLNLSLDMSIIKVNQPLGRINHYTCVVSDSAEPKEFAKQRHTIKYIYGEKPVPVEPEVIEPEIVIPDPVEPVKPKRKKKDSKKKIIIGAIVLIIGIIAYINI